MTSFTQRLMFWRKAPEGEASAPSPGPGQSEPTSLAPEELEYEAEREETLLEERRDEDRLAP